MRLLVLLLLTTVYSYGQVGIGNVNPLEQLHVGGNDSTIRIDGLSQTNNTLNNGTGSNLMVDSLGNIIIKEVTTGTSQQSASNCVYSTFEDFGAIGDGVTDDSAAIQNAVDSGKPLFVTRKTFKITSTINVVNDLFITGAGNGSVVKIEGNKNTFSVKGTNNTFQNFTIIGNNTGASQDGIKISGYYNYTGDRQNNIIKSMRISNLGGVGINSYKFYSSDFNMRWEGSLTVSDCIISDCNYGISNNARAEYNIYSNNKIQNCNIGFYTNSGNTSFMGGVITGCSNTGVYIDSGDNDAHSQVVGTMINHNTINVLAKQTRTYTFVGCTMYVGDIKTSGTGITLFKDCDFSMSGNTLLTNSKTRFSDCDFNEMPTTYSGSTQSLVIDCYNNMTLITTF